MQKILYYLTWFAVGVWAFLFWTLAEAATVWTPQAGTYFQYKIPPRMTNAYQLTTDIEVPQHWVKQEGTFTKLISGGGATKYEKIAIVVPPNNPVCEAFVCVDDFGWTFNLTKNTVLTCPMVKIDKGVAQIYDGLQSGQVKCTN